jgi:hypothetical protein
MNKITLLKTTTSLTSAVLIALIPEAAYAMPPAIVAAGLSAAATTGFSYVMGTLTASVLTTFAKSFFLNLALGLVSQSLSPKPKTAAQPAGTSAILVSGLSPVSDHQIIYGRTKIGGAVVYKEATDNNKFLHVVVALAGHEVEEIETVYLNDEALTLDVDGQVTAPDKYVGVVRINKHLGLSTQTADQDLVDESDGLWTSDHRLQGVAYVYARLEFKADAFPNGEPNITAIVKGKKVYDPRTSATAYSDNAALCFRDYLTSDYGLNSPADEIDDTLITTAANICDENVTLADSSTEKRYTTNGAFSTGVKPAEAIDSLLRPMGGTLWYSQGKWRVKAAAYLTPTLTFDEDDLRSTLQINTRHSRRDNFNIVRGTFRGSESNWQFSDFPEIKSNEFIQIDNGQESAMDLELGMVSSSATAQRIAKIALYQNREQLTLSASFGMRAFQVQVGDVILFNNSRAGFVNKPFEVLSWTFGSDGNGALEVKMTLRETSAAVYSWSAEETAFEANNTFLADPFDVPSIGLNISSEVRIINEHITNVLIAETTSPSPERIDNVEVQFRKTGATTYSTGYTGDLGRVEILDVDDGDYDIRARAINTFGIKGDFNTRLAVSVQGLADPPATVTGLIGNVTAGGLHLEWEPVPDLDLSFYRIRYSSLTAGASFANSQTAVSKVARPANSVTVPPRAGTYMIRAYDKSGNASVDYASVVISQNDLRIFTNTSTQTENPSFSGTKTGCSVISGDLRITSPATAPTTATYDFSNYIDTGSVNLCEANISANIVRIDNSASVWDNIAGNWDTWAGNWDDWSGAIQLTDIDVIQYISTTNDDPAGSPTWSAYKQFKTGDFSARALRFKIELQSSSDNVTPSISALSATVRYN